MSENRGRFTWYELMTTDVDAGIGFYQKLTNWGETSWEGPTPYKMFMMGEAPVAGVMELPEDARKAGAPPHWMGYIHTDDVDGTAAQARELGASILAQIDLPSVGRVAVVADPFGATFAAFQPESEPMPETDPVPGMFSWHELMTDDYDAAFEFYSALFGWERMEAMDMGEMGIYQMFGRNGRQLGGMMKRPEEVPCCWAYYAMVDDVDAAAEGIAANGGQVTVPPMDVPGGDRILMGVDPQGAAFAMHSRGSGETS
jgi:predicted enzyme related to lactoylglutathione lyase